MELSFRPRPKQPRPTKQGRPLGRTRPPGRRGPRDIRRQPQSGPSPKRRMIAQLDPANFPKDELEMIYGPQPQCFVRPRVPADDPHHIFGRGGTREDRFIFSSVLNHAPLCRDIHEYCPFLNTRGFRQALFDHACKHVFYAQARGLYRLSETDQLFLAWVRREGYDLNVLPQE